MAKKPSATKKLVKILGIIFVVFIFGALLAKSMGWLESNSFGHEVTTAKAEFRTITQVVSASGRIQPEVEVIIRPDVSGEIIDLAVREGDFVQEGQLLLRIKPDIYQARIDELNATLLTQRSRLEQARSSMLQAQVEYEKNQQLFERDLISELQYMQTKNNYESQKSNFKAAEYQIESAQAQLRRAEEELQQTVIRSPKSGTITRLAVEQGERVLGQAQTAGTEMMRISRMDQMELVVDVNENDIVNVTVADTAEIQVDAYPNRSFEGVVTEIANSAAVTGSGSADQVTNYSVKIRVITPHNLNSSGKGDIVLVADQESPDYQFNPDFKPGMSGTVDIRTNTAYNVVSVPIQAVTVRDFKDDFAMNSEADESVEDGSNASKQSSDEEDIRRVVFVNDGGIAKRVEVETGISNNTHIQILSGLDEGQEIVTGSYRILSRLLNHNDEITVLNQPQFASN